MTAGGRGGERGGRGGSEALAELRALLAERRAGSAGEHHARALAMGRAAARRMEFLEGVLAETRAWRDAGLIGYDETLAVRAAVVEEMDELRAGIEELSRPAPAPGIPVAKLISPTPQEAEEPAVPVLPVAPEGEEEKKAAPKPPPAPAPVPKPAAVPKPAPKPAPAASPPPPAPSPPPPPVPEEPRPPWYTVERNLRLLANLGILVFNIGLIGFITSSWGGWAGRTKVAVLVGYTVLLLGGGLLLRLKTKLQVTGTALLALAVIAVPIDFYSVYEYNLAGSLSASVLGLLGSGACMVVALGVAFATREKLFFWIAYLASVAAACYLLNALDMGLETWPGPLLLLFGGYLALGVLRERGGYAPDGVVDKLLAPAERLSMVGAAACLLLHFVMWLAVGELAAARDPGLVIAPLALGCVYFSALAVLRRDGRILAAPAILKAVILAAALRALKVPEHEWPVYFMVLGVLLVSVSALFWKKLETAWLWPHHLTGWVLGGAALLYAGVSFISQELGVGASGGMSALDVFVFTAAPPLAAGALFAVFRRGAVPTVLAGLLAVLECALLLRRFEAPWRVVPAAFLAMAGAFAVLAAFAGRDGGRRGQSAALALLADGAAALGLVCLLARVQLFWEAPGARWAALFAAGAAGLYAAQTLRGRAASFPALASGYVLLVFGARALGWEWTVLGALLAAAALLSVLTLGRLERLARFREADLALGQLAGAAAVVLAGCVYLWRPEASHWALIALALAAVLHVLTALTKRLLVLEYTGMFLAGAACLAAVHELGLSAGRLGLPALALPAGFFALSAAGRRWSWPAFSSSAFDMAAVSSLAALVLSLTLFLEGYGVLTAVAVVVPAGAVFLAAAQAAGGEDRFRNPMSLAGHSLGACALMAAAAVQVLGHGESVWPQIALLAAAGFHVHLALDRRMRVAEYAAMAAAAAAYLLFFPEFELAAGRYGLVSMALPLVFYGVSSLGRELGWRAFTESAFDMVVPASVAVLILTVLGWLGGPYLALVVAVGAVLGAGYLSLARGRAGIRTSGVGHVIAALLVAAAVCVQVGFEQAVLMPELALALFAGMQVKAALDRRARALEYSALGLFGVAYLLAWRELDLPVEHYCLAAAALPVAYYALSFAARRRSWPGFISSAFDMGAPATALAVFMAFTFSMSQAEKPEFWYRADLWYAIGTTAVLAATYLVLAFANNPRKWLHPVAANLAGTALAAGSYLLVLRVFSTGTPYRALWIMAIIPVLVVYGLVLLRKGLRPRGLAAVGVGVAVSLLALWQALLFPDKPLVATLAFAFAAALYGMLAAMLGSVWLGTAASVAFSVAYFSLLRHLGVGDSFYVLWLVALGMLQSLVGGFGGKGSRERRPAMFVGVAVSIGVISWMIYKRGLYLARGGRELDVAIWTTLGCAAVFAVVALLRRSKAAAYPAAAMLLGSYYLVLHRFAVTYTEFYTVPVAALVLLWAQLVVRPKWGAVGHNLAAGGGLGLALIPSLVLSLDRHAPEHLGHMLAAFGLALAAVLLGMFFRRKAYLVAGTAAFIIEGLIKLVHFKIAYNVTDWIWLLLVGVVILGFVLYAETRRNKRLRARAEEAREKFIEIFREWE